MAFNRSLIYLTRDRLDYYDGSLPGILPIEFTPDLVKDLDIINSAALNLKIKSFTDNNKIAPSQMMVVLSPTVYFEKEFPETAEFHQDSELQKFVDLVPFENCATKVYKSDGLSKLIAANTDFYNAIKNAFEQAGSVVEAIVPLFVLGKDITIPSNLDISTAKNILERFDLAKQNSLSTHDGLHTKSLEEKAKVDSKKDDNKSLIFLLPILITLIIVLVILYLKTSAG